MSKKRKVVDDNNHPTTLRYNAGFGNLFSSEALPGALPKGQNNPQRCPASQLTSALALFSPDALCCAQFGLYAEQLSGSAFTEPREENQRSWLYRIRPSVQHSLMEPVDPSSSGLATGGMELKVDPNQMRWMPVEIPAGDSLDFVSGLSTVGVAGDPTMKEGLAVLQYVANASMDDRCLTDADGDMLIVPQSGALVIRTEFGMMRVEPREICVVQRGMRFSVAVEGPSRGYVLEVYGGHFKLPELGPIGSNGLANPGDFLSPVASFEDRDCDYVGVLKYGGKLFESRQAFSPFNVVAYRGNYVPYKYDLRKFCCMNSVTYDHPDPSIYTVLTCPTDKPGVAAADFVIFPPRWMVMEHSFRPPWFHRNTMSEYMGMIWGEYDAKSGGGGDSSKPKGFVPGGASLHSCMSPHGPDAGTVAKASAAVLQPAFFDKGLAFMFETTYMLKLTPWALNGPHRDMDYQKCWAALPSNFDPRSPPPENGASDLMAWRSEE